MVTIFAFLAALAVLIAVHEYGHYRVAVACGVRVLRFSVGFGPVIWRWQSTVSHTEFILCAFPLGGYVRMVDEREAPVSVQDLPLAFNRQSLSKRAAIVAAGPVANLLLAVFLYALVNWSGVEQAKPILATPAIGSLAELAGLHSGDVVQRAGFAGEVLDPVSSFEELRWILMKASLDARDVQLTVSGAAQGRTHEVLMPLSTLGQQDPEGDLMLRLGIAGPWTRAVIGRRLEGGPADRSGLREGDLVVSIDGQVVHDGQQLRSMIRASLVNAEPKAGTWRIQRAGQALELSVLPDVSLASGQAVARIGAYVGAPPETVWVHYGFFRGLILAVQRTWEIAEVSLRMTGRMLVGNASLKNLSGPLSIADIAGQSASLGWRSYLVFLALISVSLGVLNLLPVPVLDGGHLMYYLWEGLTGREVSEAWMQAMQRLGLALLILMMSIALFNDFARLLG